MAKDPAFLFYPGDWLGGTMYMTMQQKGSYISLLMLQFNTGPFTLAQAEQVLSICFASDWEMIKNKFKTDGFNYWNERLALEKELRQKFTKSRRDNALGDKNKPKNKKASAKHMHKHMEDENEDENKDDYIKKDKECFELFWELYAKKVGREKAIKSWSKLSEDEKVMALQHVTMYVKSTPEVKYRKDPATYLNQKAFYDEIINNGQSKQPSAIRGLAGFTANTESLKSDLAQLHNGGAAGFNPEIPF